MKNPSLSRTYYDSENRKRFYEYSDSDKDVDKVFRLPCDQLKYIRITRDGKKTYTRVVRAFLDRVKERSHKNVLMEIVIVRADKGPRSTIFKNGNEFHVNLSSSFAIQYMSRNMNKLVIFGNTRMPDTQWVGIFNNPELRILKVVKDWLDSRRAPNPNHRSVFSLQFLKRLNPKVDYPKLLTLHIYMPLRLDTELLRKPFQINTLEEFILEDVDMYADAVEQQIFVTQVLRSLREPHLTKRWTFEAQGNRIIGIKVCLMNIINMIPLNSSDRNFMIESFRTKAKASCIIWTVHKCTQTQWTLPMAQSRISTALKCFLTSWRAHDSKQIAKM